MTTPASLALRQFHLVQPSHALPANGEVNITRNIALLKEHAQNVDSSTSVRPWESKVIEGFLTGLTNQQMETLLVDLGFLECDKGNAVKGSIYAHQDAPDDTITFSAKAPVRPNSLFNEKSISKVAQVINQVLTNQHEVLADSPILAPTGDDARAVGKSMVAVVS